MSKFRKKNGKKALLFTLAFALIIAGALAVTVFTDLNPLEQLVGPAENTLNTDPEPLPPEDGSTGEEVQPPEPVVFNIPDRMRAVTLMPGEDFLTEENEPAEQVRKEIDAALDAAGNLGMNTVLVGTSND